MGKIVKFCSSCDEGFAEKFGFCPNCGQPLQTFEMNPVVATAPPVLVTPTQEAVASPAPPVQEVLVQEAFAPPLPLFEKTPVVQESPAPVATAAPITVIEEVAPIAAAPVQEVVASPAPPAAEPVKYFEPRFIEEPVVELPAEPEPVIEETILAQPVATEPIIEEAVMAQPVDLKPEIEEVVKALPVEPEPVVKRPAKAVVPAVAATAAKAAASTYVPRPAADVDRKPRSLVAEHDKVAADGGYYITVIEEKNVGTRRALLLGSLMFMLTVLMGAMVYNLFSKDLDVGSIDDEIFNAVIVDTEPMTIEQEKQLKKDKDGGGGGGGGREEKEETTQGDLANQTKNPTRPPDAKVFRSDNFELKMPPPETEGNQKYDRKFDRWGDPNGRFASFSNGTGSGGGQGTGVGTGQGSGRGTGNGSGTGSGSGGGLGDGNGNGTGSGNGDLPPPPPKIAGVTQGIKIISKPRPGYTDAARQANVQGTVILRVVFLASGQIGSISPVKGLPNGLTEQAIAAARRISFEPAKNNGIAQSVTKQIEYSFSIY